MQFHYDDNDRSNLPDECFPIVNYSVFPSRALYPAQEHQIPYSQNYYNPWTMNVHSSDMVTPSVYELRCDDDMYIDDIYNYANDFMIADDSNQYQESSSTTSESDSAVSSRISSEVRVDDSIPLTPLFVQAVFNLMNYGEFDNLRDLVEGGAKRNYELMLCKSNRSEILTGNGIFVQLWKSVFDMCPDLIMSNPNIKYHGKGSNYRIIETSYLYHCTYPLGDGMHLRGFRDDKFRKTYDIMNDVDKNIPEKKLAKFRRIIAEAKATTKLITVDCRGFMHFYVDEFSNRIGKFKISFVALNISKYKGK